MCFRLAIAPGLLVLALAGWLQAAEDDLLPAAGEHCLVCDSPMSDAGHVRLHRGRRVPL